jgi:hypothetical protein
MYVKSLVDHYFCHYNQLTQDLYLCWHYSFCQVSKQLDEAKLRMQIRSHGFSNHPHQLPKRLPISFRDQYYFKIFRWINKFTPGMEENSLRDYTDLYDGIINEVSERLCQLSNKVNRRAFAHKIMIKLDKTHVHDQQVDRLTLDLRFKELFEYVLNHRFLANDTSNTRDLPSKGYLSLESNCDLSVRLFCHFYFVEKIICEFQCYEIDLLALAEERGYNLFVFNECDKHEDAENVNVAPSPKIKLPFLKIEPAKTIMPEIVELEIQELERIGLRPIPRFKCSHSPECLLRLMCYLIKQKFLSPSTSDDQWLYWFDLGTLTIASPLHWIGASATMLSNIIQHLCGKCIAKTVKTAFPANKFANPTRKVYEAGNTYKEIEQIITISRQSGK